MDVEQVLELVVIILLLLLILLIGLWKMFRRGPRAKRIQKRWEETVEKRER